MKKWHWFLSVGVLWKGAVEAAGHQYHDASCLYTLSIQDSTGGKLSADRRAHAQWYFCDMAWVQLWPIHLQARSCIQKNSLELRLLWENMSPNLFFFLATEAFHLWGVWRIYTLKVTAHWPHFARSTSVHSFVCYPLSEYLGLSLSRFLPLPENFLPPVQIYNHLFATRRLPLSAPLSLLSLYI